MSISFLAIPPFTDLEVLKDRAKTLSRSGVMTHSKALDHIAKETTRQKWEHLLQSDVATFAGDGCCYCAMFGIPLKISSLRSDGAGKPVAVGDRVHLSVRVERSCTIPSSADKGMVGYDGEPGLSVIYRPVEQADQGKPGVHRVPSPTMVDGKVVSEESYSSREIALRARLGPVVETVRLWVARQLMQRIPRPQDLPEEEYSRLMSLEHKRREDNELRYHYEDMIDLIRSQYNPHDAGAFAPFLLLEAPLLSDAYHLLASQISDPIDTRLHYAWAAFEIESDYLERYHSSSDLAFWDDWQTRGFMRHGRHLADLLGQSDQGYLAIDILERLYKANPRDNQGNRYPLCSHLLERGRPEDIARIRDILNQGKDDVGRDPMATYISALTDYAEHGDSPGARRARDLALSLNPHIPGMIGRVEFLVLPEAYSWGDEQEAIFCLSFLEKAILKMPGAADWLRVS